MQTKYRNQHKVILRYITDVDFEEAWLWCKITLEGNWSTDWDYWFNLYGYKYIYYYENEDWSVWTFDNEDDALMFKLMWG